MECDDNTCRKLAAMWRTRGSLSLSTPTKKLLPPIAAVSSRLPLQRAASNSSTAARTSLSVVLDQACMQMCTLTHTESHAGCLVPGMALKSMTALCADRTAGNNRARHCMAMSLWVLPLWGCSAACSGICGPASPGTRCSADHAARPKCPPGMQPPFCKTQTMLSPVCRSCFATDSEEGGSYSLMQNG